MLPSSIPEAIIGDGTKYGEEYRNDHLVIVKLAGDKVASIQLYMDSAYANAKLVAFRR